jgi:hypothetical protein
VPPWPSSPAGPQPEAPPGRSPRPGGGPSSIGGDQSLWHTVTGTLAPEPAVSVGALLGTGALVTLAAIGVFRSSEHRAKERGLLDQTTGS